jgi:hypothetical protein
MRDLGTTHRHRHRAVIDTPDGAGGQNAVRPSQQPRRDDEIARAMRIARPGHPAGSTVRGDNSEPLHGGSSAKRPLAERHGLHTAEPTVG